MNAAEILQVLIVVALIGACAAPLIAGLLDGLDWLRGRGRHGPEVW